MEGVPPTPRRPRAQGSNKKSAKTETKPKGDSKSSATSENVPLMETRKGVVELPAKLEPFRKQEPVDYSSETILAVTDRASLAERDENVSDSPALSAFGQSMPSEGGIAGEEASGVVAETLLKAEPDIKMESGWDD